MTKTRKKISFYNFILLLLFISFIFYLIDNWKVSQDTYIVKEGVIENSIEGTSTIIRDEKIVYADDEGEISFYKNQNDKVKTGTLIAQQFKDSDSKSYTDEIKIIDEIINIKQGQSITNTNVENTYIDDMKNRIQESMISMDMVTLHKLISNTKNNDYNEKYYNYGNNSISELLKLKESLKHKISSEHASYYSPMGGLVSYTFDNIENIYSFERLDSLDINDIRKLDYINENSLNKVINKGDKLFKIIDSFNWYLALELDKKYYSELKDEKNIKLRLKKINKTIISSVYKLKTYGEKTLILLKIDKYLYDYIDDRYINIDIIMKEFNGLIVAKSSITTYENMIGVFVSDANKIVKFRPIEIKGENEEYVVVSEGEKLNSGSRGKILINDENYYTIKTYDSIVVNPTNVHDGQILR